MPEFPLALRNPHETLTILLNKRPTRGEWFEVFGMTVRVEDVRHVASEVVVFGVRVRTKDRASLNPQRQRSIIGTD
jgi:hypothetical protein